MRRAAERKTLFIIVYERQPDVASKAPMVCDNDSVVTGTPRCRTLSHRNLANLIVSINDGAKAAQAGALVFMALGVYLLAVAISTTDEDLLLGHATNLTQLGVQISPAVSFAIASLVFVAVHVFTLIRYDMLGTNLRQFNVTLEAITMIRTLLARRTWFVVTKTGPGNGCITAADRHSSVRRGSQRAAIMV